MADERRTQRRTWRSLFRLRTRREEDKEEEDGVAGVPRWSMGILNDRFVADVAGSVRLLASDSSPSDMVMSKQQQKRDRSGKFILAPQPTQSPNDPLNWPSLHRDAALGSLGLYCMIGGGITPILAAGFTDVAHDYGVRVERVSLTTGLYMMGLGLGSVLAAPTALLYGKRPLYLGSALLSTLMSVWCAVSPSFGSLVGARIFHGMAASPVECLPSVTIAEIFFLHERAFRIGVYTLLLLGGKNLMPLVSAVIIQNMGWRWVFWIVTLAFAFCGLLLFFFVPETFWDRRPVIETVQPNSSGVKPDAQIRPLGEKATLDRVGRDGSVDESTVAIAQSFGASVSANPTKHFLGDGNTIAAAANPSATQEQVADLERRPNPTLSHPNPYTHNLLQQPPKSFVHRLNPFPGRLSTSFWPRIAIRPFLLLGYPAVIYSALTYSCCIGWLVVLSESVALVYRNSKSYNFSALQTGLVYISPFIGAILGTAVAGRASDLLVRYMARANGSVYEPEFRLVMGLPVAITTVMGLIGFGWATQEKDVWIVPTFFFGVVSFGCSLGSTMSITFVIDTYREHAGEAMVALSFCKNVLHGLVFSLFVTGWIGRDGAKDVYVWIGVMQVAALATTVPMYVWGKRARAWTQRHGWVDKG